MTQHTERDLVWDVTMRIAMSKDSFDLESIAKHDAVSVSERTVRDTVETMVDLDWLERKTTDDSQCQWRRGPLLTGEKDPMTTQEEGTKQSPKSLANVDRIAELDHGEVYAGTVDKAAQNALIWLDESSNRHVNLGPIDGSVVGEEVRFRYLRGVWGECLEKKYIYAGYDPREDGSSQNQPPLSVSSEESEDGTITDNNPKNKNKLLKGKL